MTKGLLAASPCPQDGGAPYHTGLFLCICLLDPAQLRQREDGGDGIGRGELVVAARGPLQLQPWEEEVKPMEWEQPRHSPASGSAPLPPSGPLNTCVGAGGGLEIEAKTADLALHTPTHL